MTSLQRPVLGWAALLILAVAAALTVGWTGYIASDDSLYYAAASHWLSAPPFPGDTHWATRFPLVLSFAGLLAVTGRSFAAFATTALIFYALLLVVTGRFAARLAGPRAGWIAAVLASTLPVVVSEASTVGVDLIEASFLLGGAMLLGEQDASPGRGFAAGLMFGLAMLCRETTLLPLMGLGVLFVIGRPVPRPVLLAAGLGAAAVLGAEALFQGWATGEPLRRYTIAFHHDEHIDRAANMEGNLLIHPAVDPVLVLLVNNDFGLLFWLAGAGAVAGMARGLDVASRARLIVLGTMAAASFVLVAVLVHKLVLNPRYFMLPALFAVMLVAMWMDGMSVRRRAVLLAGYTASNLLLLALANGHPRRDMEVLLDAARGNPRETVHADPVNVRHAGVSIELEGVRNISAAPPPAGSLAVVPDNGASPGRVVARYPSPPTVAGGMIRAVGLEPLVPAALHRRIFAPAPAMALVRTAPAR